MLSTPNILYYTFQVVHAPSIAQSVTVYARCHKSTDYCHASVEFCPLHSLRRVGTSVARMACNSRTITEAILLAYYPLVLTLRVYVSLLTGQKQEQRDRLTHETDTLRYRNFLDDYLVASPNSPCDMRKLQINPSVGHFRDVGGPCSVVSPLNAIVLRLSSECRYLY